MNKKETPLMHQYNSIRKKYPDALLLFRVGDFYETFGVDAIKTSKILGIVLTKRKNGSASEIELAGFPHHSLDTYLPKLVRAGERVAICDQLEESNKQRKTIVKRGITELVTPGVSYNEKTIENKNNNFLAAVHFHSKQNELGVAFLDISTGEFYCSQGQVNYIDKLLQSFSPNEVLVERTKIKNFEKFFGNKFYSYLLEDWVFSVDLSNKLLLNHFQTKTLKGFGIENFPLGIISAGACLQYLKETEHHQTKHITKISRIEETNYVWLDKFTTRNLEIFHSPHFGAKTLIDVIDHTVSPMGARQLKRWVSLPLKNLIQINERHDVVEHFLKCYEERNQLRELIYQMGDMERLISKVAVQKINPREILHLCKGLEILVEIKKICDHKINKPLHKFGEQIQLCKTIRDKIRAEIKDNAPIQIQKGEIIKDGINEELDELRKIAFSSKDYLLELQEKEIKKHGISSLKIGFNNIFGYYLEVRNTHKNKVPEEWIRKQTLVNAERYITEELKIYEEKILGAEEKIEAIEQKIFQNLVLEISEYTKFIQMNSQIISQLDCLLSFANIASEYKYTRPQLNESLKIEIKNGRHPVIEQQLPIEEEYIANSIILNNKEQQIIMITGPNMSGKSALLRQTALIVLLAQIGSFVPAENASLGLVDKIFTRVGASDNISMGESTFMVEMNETASILNNLSSRSLILLDEIGRGTSTYDGISIAWSIAQFLHEHHTKPKTLFATHYHELNEMTKTFSRIANYNVTIKQIDHKIIFIRKLAKGGSNHSFGIHVAKLAGMPKEVIKIAKEILLNLEKSHKGNKNNSTNILKKKKTNQIQLSIFQMENSKFIELQKKISVIDIDTLTPIEAMMKLAEIKKLLS